jgi:hypothetical protein
LWETLTFLENFVFPKRSENYDFLVFYLILH